LEWHGFRKGRRVEPSDVDRRPIAARNLRALQSLAMAFARAGVSANAISVSGMVFGVAAGVCLSQTSAHPEWALAFWLAGAAFVQLRLLANLLDGMVAMERKTASRIGELYNEVPDRVSDYAILVGLGYSAGGHVVWGYAAACFAILTAYIRAMGKAAGVPNQFCGPMAKQQRMFIVTILSIYCAFAPPAWKRCEIGGRIYGMPELALIIIAFGSMLTASRRLRRIAAALRSSP
jgi:phosphatidylglycerophosphate synthase